MPEQNGNTVNITLIFATQLNALKEFNRQKHIHVCYTALESYFRFGNKWCFLKLSMDLNCFQDKAFFQLILFCKF